ncbi:hypothetical protein ACRWEA_06505 [Escherichia coli]
MTLAPEECEPVLDYLIFIPIYFSGPVIPTGIKKGNTMLEGYFANAANSTEEAIKMNQRLLAVQAALEIAKASASAGSGVMHSNLTQATDYVEKLADAIQVALKNNIDK